MRVEYKAIVKALFWYAAEYENMQKYQLVFWKAGMYASESKKKKAVQSESKISLFVRDFISHIECPVTYVGELQSRLVPVPFASENLQKLCYVNSYPITILF